MTEGVPTSNFPKRHRNGKGDAFHCSKVVKTELKACCATMAPPHGTRGNVMLETRRNAHSTLSICMVGGIAYIAPAARCLSILYASEMCSVRGVQIA